MIACADCGLPITGDLRADRGANGMPENVRHLHESECVRLLLGRADRAERQAEALAKALEEGRALIQKPDPFMRDEVDDWAQRAAAVVAAYREGQ